jgi:hypothetical protein
MDFARLDKPCNIGLTAAMAVASLKCPLPLHINKANSTFTISHQLHKILQTYFLLISRGQYSQQAIVREGQIYGSAL